MFLRKKKKKLPLPGKNKISGTVNKVWGAGVPSFTVMVRAHSEVFSSGSSARAPVANLECRERW